MAPAEEPTRSDRPRLILVAALAVLCLGTWGFALYQPAASVVDDAYRAVQLFFLELGSVSGDLPWQLEVARLAAPALTAVSAVLVLALVSRTEIDRWRARRRRGHVVVCGLGRRGTSAATALRQAGHQVVGIELDPTTSGVRRCRAAGIPVVVGDAREPAVLTDAGVVAAEHLVLLTPALELGGAIALAAIGLVDERRATPLVIHLEVDDPGLAAVLRAMTMTEHRSASWRLEELDLAGVGARAMLDAQPPWPAGAGRASALVVGVSALGVAVATQLRRRWTHLGGPENGLTVIVLDREPTDADLARPEPPVSAAYVCLDDEAAALAAAVGILRRLPGTPLLVRLEKATALAAVLRRDAPTLHCMSLDQAVLTPEVLLDSTVERIARALHDAYRRTATEGDPAAVSWDQLPEQLRSSNRAQAADVAEKIRLTGCTLVPDDGEPPAAFRVDEVEILGRAEHERWMRERLAAGWSLGPRNTASRVSPYLVPWETLDEDVREVDRRFVRALPDLLGDAGLLLRRQAA
jgi:voltage-gated potassium channel Kch